MTDIKDVNLSSSRKEVAVLFADIRNFTPFVEGLEPEEVSEYINEYFTEMVEIILANKGTVDKFMGDAIMAFWGAPNPLNNHYMYATIAALEMLKKLKELNVKWSRQGKKMLDIGIGLNTGIVLVGNFGSPRLMDFTVMGDVVNLASRLESLNKEENTNILMSDDIYQGIKDRVNVRFIGPRKLKGKTNAVNVYEFISHFPDAI